MFIVFLMEIRSQNRGERFQQIKQCLFTSSNWLGLVVLGILELGLAALGISGDELVVLGILKLGLAALGILDSGLVVLRTSDFRLVALGISGWVTGRNLTDCGTIASEE